MRARIVRIGNSKGIRIPKALLVEAGLKDEAELAVRDGALVVSPVRRVREGWADAAQAMAAGGEEALLEPPVATRFDEEEWTW